MSSSHLRVNVVFFFIFLMPIGGLSDGSPPEESKKGSTLESLKVSSFEVMESDMEQALEALIRTVPSKMLVGLEKAQGERTDFSLQLKDANMGEVLRELCKSDPRYTYEFIGNSLINVFPLRARRDKWNLLNIRVQHTVIEEKRTPSDIIRRISDFAPELSRYLEDKANERAKATGIPHGAVGARMSGDMDPQITLEFRNMTVRDILNAISLHSIELSRQNSYLPPVSWKYEFVVDPSATTGLGGYPKWDVF